MADIHELKRPANDHVIRELERLLDEAREGKIIGFAICCSSGTDTLTLVRGEYDRPRLHYGLSKLAHKVISDTQATEGG